MNYFEYVTNSMWEGICLFHKMYEQLIRFLFPGVGPFFGLSDLAFGLKLMMCLFILYWARYGYLLCVRERVQEYQDFKHVPSIFFRIIIQSYKNSFWALLKGDFRTVLRCQLKIMVSLTFIEFVVFFFLFSPEWCAFGYSVPYIMMLVAGAHRPLAFGIFMAYVAIGGTMWEVYILYHYFPTIKDWVIDLFIEDGINPWKLAGVNPRAAIGSIFRRALRPDSVMIVLFCGGVIISGDVIMHKQTLDHNLQVLDKTHAQATIESAAQRAHEAAQRAHEVAILDKKIELAKAQLPKSQ